MTQELNLTDIQNDPFTGGLWPVRDKNPVAQKSAQGHAAFLTLLEVSDATVV